MIATHYYGTTGWTNGTTILAGTYTRGTADADAIEVYEIRVVASTPSDLPSLERGVPPKFPRVTVRRMASQVRGAHRAQRFLQGPICRGGMK